MRLEGSCHCGGVTFTVTAHEPVPFMRCYCSICRKTAGAGGYAVNLGADARTLQVTKGRRHLRIYRALLHDAETGETHISSGQRHFCGKCGSALWLFDPDHPELVHPHAGAIDTPLPKPSGNVHIMLGSRAAWVDPEGRPGDMHCNGYPDVTLAGWHREHGLTSKD